MLLFGVLALQELPDLAADHAYRAQQSLVRLAAMSGDARYLEWARRIGDAYVSEVLARNHGLPGYSWDFQKHEGPDRMRLRDHGNEMVVGLALLHALEASSGRSLADWSHAWLETAGPNTLRSEFEVDGDGVFTSFAVLQEAPEQHPTLRPHHIAIGLYEVDFLLSFWTACVYVLLVVWLVPLAVRRFL